MRLTVHGDEDAAQTLVTGKESIETAPQGEAIESSAQTQRKRNVVGSVYALTGPETITAAAQMIMATLPRAALA